MSTQDKVYIGCVALYALAVIGFVTSVIRDNWRRH